MESSALLPAQVSGSTGWGRFLCVFLCPERGTFGEGLQPSLMPGGFWWKGFGWTVELCCLLASWQVVRLGHAASNRLRVVLASSRGLFQAQDAAEAVNLLSGPPMGLRIRLVMGVFAWFKTKGVFFSFSSRVSQGSRYLPGHRHVVFHPAVALQHPGLAHQPRPRVSK